MHEHVGRRLKEMFDEVTTQPIPDRFVKLLAELEQRQSEQLERFSISERLVEADNWP